MKKILLFVLLVLCSAGCERESKNVAGKSENDALGSPGYQVVENRAAPPNVVSVAELSAKGASVDGGEVFARTCAACHQGSGKGIPAVFPPLDGSPYVVSDNVDRLGAIMIYGLSGPIHVLGTQYNSAMAPMGAVLKDEELAAVASYVRSSWSNNAPAVETEVFTKLRNKYGTRGPFTIQELGEEK